MLTSKILNSIIKNVLIVGICLVSLSCAKLKSEIIAEVEQKLAVKINSAVQAGLINHTDNSTNTNDWRPFVYIGCIVAVVAIVVIIVALRAKKIEAEEEIALSHGKCHDVQIPRH